MKFSKQDLKNLIKEELNFLIKEVEEKQFAFHKIYKDNNGRINIEYFAGPKTRVIFYVPGGPQITAPEEVDDATKDLIRQDALKRMADFNIK